MKQSGSTGWGVVGLGVVRGVGLGVGRGVGLGVGRSVTTILEGSTQKSYPLGTAMPEETGHPGIPSSASR